MGLENPELNIYYYIFSSDHQGLNTRPRGVQAPARIAKILRGIGGGRGTFLLRAGDGGFRVENRDKSRGKRWAHARIRGTFGTPKRFSEVRAPPHGALRSVPAALLLFESGSPTQLRSVGHQRPRLCGHDSAVHAWSIFSLPHGRYRQLGLKFLITATKVSSKKPLTPGRPAPWR